MRAGDAFARLSSTVGYDPGRAKSDDATGTEYCPTARECGWIFWVGSHTFTEITAGVSE